MFIYSWFACLLCWLQPSVAASLCKALSLDTENDKERNLSWLWMKLFFFFLVAQVNKFVQDSLAQSRHLWWNPVDNLGHNPIVFKWHFSLKIYKIKYVVVFPVAESNSISNIQRCNSLTVCRPCNTSWMVVRDYSFKSLTQSLLRNKSRQVLGKGREIFCLEDTDGQVLAKDCEIL